MRKILFIVNVDWFFISHRLPIALASIKQGYEVHIACEITDKKMMLESLGLIVHPITLSRSGTGIFSEFKTLKQLFIIINLVRPDITHSITIKPVLYGNIISRLLRVPTRVASISGLGYVFIAFGIKAKFFRVFIALLYRLALSNAKTVIFQNSSDRDVLKKLGAIKPEQEFFIRGSGVDLSLYPVFPEPKDKLVVMLVARLLIDKGVYEFVKAAEIINAQVDNVRMVLVGSTDPGNPKSVSMQRINSWVDAGIIEYWGHSAEVATTMSKSNIIVLPSYREGLPKVLIEAAACGRAVVTTDVPGCRDAIEPNETGLLVDVKSASSLASGILSLISNDNLRYKFAKNARKLAERDFNINDVVLMHLSIYSKE
ncbi:glycosyltransferase family 4 protein [Candidatus Pseudothioglobus singularis]|nr:glycosyltransferase family 4 protein [Candidatus Pseudothioglobus singularis]